MPRTSFRVGERRRRPGPPLARELGRATRRSLSLLVSCRLCRRHASHRAAREVKARAGEAGVEDNGWQRVIEGGAALVGWAVSCIDTASTLLRHVSVSDTVSDTDT